MENQHRKKSRWALPWIITLVLVAGLLGWLWWLNQRTIDKPAIAAPAAMPKTIDPAIAVYLSFIDTGDSRMALDHHYTHEALTKLADAIRAVARSNDITLSEPIDSVKRYAGNITVDKYATSHADDIRRAAEIACNALAELQTAKYPALQAEVAALRERAAAIDPDKLTLDQRAEVKGFFKDAAGIIRKMK